MHAFNFLFGSFFNPVNAKLSVMLKHFYFYCHFQQGDNFVVAALFCAVEEGNLKGLEELFSVANIDVNQCNKVSNAIIYNRIG